MDISAFKTLTDSEITNKTAPDSISPVIVGNTINRLADLTKAAIDPMSQFQTVPGTVLPNIPAIPLGHTYVGAGTYTQTTGGSITVTGNLNLLNWVSAGATGSWSVGIQFNISTTIDLSTLMKVDDGVFKSDLYTTYVPKSKKLNSSVLVDTGYTGSVLGALAGATCTEKVSVNIPSTGKIISTYGVVGAGVSATTFKTFAADGSLIASVAMSSGTVNTEGPQAMDFNLTNTLIKFVAIQTTNSNAIIADFGVYSGPFSLINNVSINPEFISGVLKTSDVLNAQTNLAKPLPAGYRYSAPTTNQLVGGQIFTGIFKIPCVSGQKFLINWKGTSSNATLGSCFNAAGQGAAGLTIASSLTPGKGGSILTIPEPTTAGNTIRSFYVFFANAEVDINSVVIVDGDSYSPPKVKPELFTDDEKRTVGWAIDFYLKGMKSKVVDTLASGYISAGQSNEAGRIDQAELPAFWAANGNQLPGVIINNANVLNWHTYNATDFDTANGNTYWSYEMLLFNMIIANKRSVNPAANIYVVKKALGGTSINYQPGSEGAEKWAADYEKIPAGFGSSQLQILETRIRAAMASANGSLYATRGVIWHQGESDRNDPYNYYQNLKNVIYYIRGVIGNSTLPWMLGGINSSSTQFNKVVDEAKQQLASDDPYCFYAAPENGTAYLKSDVLHFNYAGANDMATKMYAIMNATAARKTLWGLS